MTQEASDSSPRPRWPRIASVVLVGGFATALFVSPSLRGFFAEAWNVLTSGEEQRITRWVGRYGAWGPAVIILLMVLQMFLIVVPSWLLMVVAVLAYGPWWGGLIAVTAVLAASSTGYGVGALVGQHGLERLLKDKTLRRMERETDRYGLWGVVVARINPLFSNDAISLVAGLLRMGFGRFLIATLGGILPLVILIAWFGSGWERMKTGLIWLSVASLLGLVAKVVVDHRKDRSGRQDTERGRHAPDHAR